MPRPGRRRTPKRQQPESDHDDRRLYGIARSFTLKAVDDRPGSRVDAELRRALGTGGLPAFLATLDSRGSEHRDRFESFLKHIVDPGPVVVDRPSSRRTFPARRKSQDASAPIMDDEP